MGLSHPFSGRIFVDRFIPSHGHIVTPMTSVPVVNRDT